MWGGWVAAANSSSGAYRAGQLTGLVLLAVMFAVCLTGLITSRRKPPPPRVPPPHARARPAQEGMLRPGGPGWYQDYNGLWYPPPTAPPVAPSSTVPWGTAAPPGTSTAWSGKDAPEPNVGYALLFGQLGEGCTRAEVAPQLREFLVSNQHGAARELETIDDGTTTWITFTLDADDTGEPVTGRGLIEVSDSNYRMAIAGGPTRAPADPDRFFASLSPLE